MGYTRRTGWIHLLYINVYSGARPVHLGKNMDAFLLNHGSFFFVLKRVCIEKRKCTIFKEEEYVYEIYILYVMCLHIQMKYIVPC